MGSRFRSYPKPDTVTFTPSTSDTLLATIDTCSGTWYADSGTMIVRQVMDTIVLGDLDIWLHGGAPTLIRMTGSYIAIGHRN